MQLARGSRAVGTTAWPLHLLRWPNLTDRKDPAVAKVPVNISFNYGYGYDSDCKTMLVGQSVCEDPPFDIADRRLRSARGLEGHGSRPIKQVDLANGDP